MSRKFVVLPLSGSVLIELEASVDEKESEVVSRALEMFWEHDTPQEVFNKDLNLGGGATASVEVWDVSRVVHEGGGVWYGEGVAKAYVEN